jgi:hypothetical protein
MRSYDREASGGPHAAPRALKQDREDDDQVQRLLADRASGRDSTHGSRDAPAVMHLQRTAGNAAVASLLEAPAGRPASAFVALQRIPLATAGEDVLESQTYLLPDLQVPNRVLQGPAVRADMRALPRLGRSATAKRKALDNMVEMLKMVAEHNGPEAAKTAAGIKSAAKRLSGGRRRSLKAAIDRYKATKPRLRGLMKDIEGARAGVVESTMTLESKNIAQERLKTGRDKDKAVEDLKGWEDKRKSAIQVLEGFVDFATLVIDPEKGITAALDKAKGLVGNTIQDFAFGGTYAEQIRAAGDKVRGLTEKVKGLEDRQALAEIEAAAAGLRRAQATLEAKLEELIASVYEAETAQLDLQKELGGLGKSGQAASEALDEGTAVLETADEAALKSKALRDFLLSIRSGARKLVDDSNMYRELLEGGQGTLSGTVEGTPQEQRAWARDVLVQNVRRAGEWTAWLAKEETELDKIDAFMRAGSYRTGYERGIEASLAQVRKSI